VKGSFIYISFQSGKSKPFFSPISPLIRISDQSLRPETRRSPPGDPSEDRSGAICFRSFSRRVTAKSMKTPAKTEAKNFSGTGFPIFADFCGTAEKKSAGFVCRPVEFSDNYSPFFLVFEMEI